MTDMQAKIMELEARFKELDNQRRAHLQSADACYQEMLKTEGAWEILRSFFNPLETTNGDEKEKACEEKEDANGQDAHEEDA